MRLILVRHGDSDHGKDGRILRPADCPGLTALGFEQVNRLARRLQVTREIESCDLFLASPFTRARQTAAGLAGVIQRPLVIEDDLQEQRWGEAEGLTQEEYRRRYGAFDRFSEPDRPLAPGGESWNAVCARVLATLERLAGVHPNETIVACTHGGFIFLSIFVLFNPGYRRRAFLDPGHTGLTEWTFAPGQNLWTLVRYNDTTHLMAFETDTSE
jgi:probable phosphoglycerate mutase